jgi:hypothetical protein
MDRIEEVVLPDRRSVCVLASSPAALTDRRPTQRGNRRARGVGATHDVARSTLLGACLAGPFRDREPAAGASARLVARVGTRGRAER